MEILGRADSGRATHDFVNALRWLEIRFSFGSSWMGQPSRPVTAPRS
jgi:hypothetical protein